MKDIQKNIEKLMKAQNIKTQTDLLMMIADKLHKNRYEFNKIQKANFSKMLKGTRTMNDEFIIPLEEILHVTYAEMVNGDIYNLPEDKKFKPFLKGIRYYAYKDEPELYKELLKEIDDDGRPIVANFDEYEYAFIDYLVKYKSKNGIKFLINEFGFYYHPFMSFNIKSKDGIPLYHRIDDVNLAIAIVDFDDPVMFNKVFDPFDNVKEYQYLSLSNVYKKPEYIDALLNNDHILKSLYSIKKIKIQEANPNVRFLKDEGEGIFINPVLTIILDYALQHLDKYKYQADEIINFGIKANKNIIKTLDKNWYIEENGFVKYRGCYPIVGAVLISNYQTVGNKKIDSLISTLNKGVNYGK